MAKGSKDTNQQKITMFVIGLFAGFSLFLLLLFIFNAIHGLGISPLYLQFLVLLLEFVILYCTMTYFNR
jgi:hypothetical protein